MKEKRIVKVEKVGVDSLHGNWGIVGQLTGRIYYQSNRFDCCSELGNSRDRYEKYETENHDEYKRQQSTGLILEEEAIEELGFPGLSYS